MGPDTEKEAAKNRNSDSKMSSPDVHDPPRRSEEKHTSSFSELAAGQHIRAFSMLNKTKLVSVLVLCSRAI